MSEGNPQNMIVEDDEDEISILDLLLVIVENIKLLILGPIIAGLIGLTYAFTITPIFTAVTVIQPPAQGGQAGTSAAILESLGGLGGGLAGGAIKETSQLYIAYMQSTTFEDNLVEQFKLQEKFKAKYRVDARKTLKSKVMITSDKKTGMISIAVDDADPKFAAELANAYVTELRVFTGKLALQEAQDRKEFLENQLKELSTRQFRDVFTQQALIAGTIRQYEAARIDEEKIGPTFIQVDVAQVPELKSKPKRAQIARNSALVVGFALLVFIFARHAWRLMSAKPQSEGKLELILAALKEQWRGKKRKKTA